MHAHKLGLVAAVSLVSVLSAGCPDKAKNESIELTNQGVEKFNNQSWDKAIQLFKDATAKYPQNHQAWYSMGEVYAKQDMWKEAAEAYSEAAKNKSDDAMYNMRLGQARFEAAKKAVTDKDGNVGKYGDLSTAQTALEHAVQLNKDLFRAYYYLGRIYQESDKPKEAAEAFTRCASLNPSFGPAFIELGKLYIEWDKFDEAVRVLSQGVQHVLDPEELTDVYYNLGYAYDMKARMTEGGNSEFLDKAIEAYSKALDARADNNEAKLMRGLAYTRKGDKSKAEADLDAYVKRGAGSPFDKYEATKALYSLGGSPM